MFNLYIQESLKDLRYEHKRGIRVNRVLVPVLCFVNDTAILVGNKKKYHLLKHNYNTEQIETKTEILIFNNTQRLYACIIVENIKRENTNGFTYVYINFGLT